MASVTSLIDGKYRVERAIAEGGMGIVVLATQLQLDRRVAIKYLRPHARAVPGVVERFEREARLAAKIESEHVVRVHDVGVSPECGPYMVMEYLEGQDLGALAQRGPIAIEDAVDFVVQACDALAEAHALAIVHRDLKPENLFLAERPPRRPIIKIIDFGISKIAPKQGEGGRWTEDQTLGTPLYMSPEQLRGEANVDRRADIWALGIVLHELVAGAPPFHSASIQELCTSILDDAPPSLSEVRPDVPQALAAVVQRCLEKRPDRRFGDVTELAQALAPFGREESKESATKVATAGRATPQKRDPRRAAATVVIARPSPWRTWALVALAGITFAAGVAIVATVVVGRTASEPPPLVVVRNASEPAPPAPTNAVAEPAPADPNASAGASTSSAKRPGRRPISTSTSKDPRSQFGERK